MRVYIRAANDKVPDVISLLTARMVCDAQHGNDAALLDLLVRFRPLCARCIWRAGQTLPHEAHNILLAEVRYEFIVLIHEFDAERGVPFAGYITAMLPRRVFDWAQKENRCRHEAAGSAAAYDPGDEFDGMSGEPCESCVAAGDLASDVETGLWWWQAMEELTGPQRQVMELVRQGVTEREIAQQMHVTQTAAHQLKCRAQKKLQKKW
jgi:RNA polymerase sigma factor (sigma-70 family)